MTVNLSVDLYSIDFAHSLMYRLQVIGGGGGALKLPLQKWEALLLMLMEEVSSFHNFPLFLLPPFTALALLLEVSVTCDLSGADFQ